MLKTPKTKTKNTIVVAVLHALLNVEQFATYVDAVETLKTHCARLRIPYGGTAISDAIRAVEHTGRRVVTPEQSGRTPLQLAAAAHSLPVPLGREEARAICMRLYAGLHERGER